MKSKAKNQFFREINDKKLIDLGCIKSRYEINLHYAAVTEMLSLQPTSNDATVAVNDIAKKVYLGNFDQIYC